MDLDADDRRHILFYRFAAEPLVAGPLVESEAYLQTLRQAATRLGGPGFSDRIARSTLGAYAGALGAAWPSS